MYDGLVILENGDFNFFTGKNNDSASVPYSNEADDYYDDHDSNLDPYLEHGK